MRESMHVTIATPAWATPSKFPPLKSAAYSALAAIRSSKSAGMRQTVSVGQQHQREQSSNNGAPCGSGENGVLLDDACFLEQPIELRATAAPVADLPYGG